MRTEKQKQSFSRNFSILLLTGISSNLHLIRAKCKDRNIRMILYNVISEIELLLYYIKKTNYESWKTFK